MAYDDLKDGREMKEEYLKDISSSSHIYSVPPLNPLSYECKWNIKKDDISTDIKNDCFYMNKKIEELDANLKELKEELEKCKKNNICNSVSNNISYYINYLNNLKESLTQEHKKFIINTSLGFFIGIGMNLFFR